MSTSWLSMAPAREFSPTCTQRVGFASPSMLWWRNLNLQNSWLNYQSKGRLGHGALTYPLQVHPRPWSDMLSYNLHPVRPTHGPHLGSTCPLLEGCQHELKTDGYETSHPANATFWEPLELLGGCGGGLFPWAVLGMDEAPGAVSPSR